MNHAIEETVIHDSLAFLLSHFHRTCTWSSAAEATRRYPWPGRGPGASWPSCAPPTFASPPRSRRPSCRRYGSSTCPCRRSPPWKAGPRAGWWGVGLQLAALSLKGCPDPDAFLDSFTGAHRYVLDYLTEEVLERQPDRLIEEAIRHALACGDTPWATRLVEQHMGKILRRGEGGLEQWLALLPDEAVRSRPRLCLAQAMTELNIVTWNRSSACWRTPSAPSPSTGRSRGRFRSDLWRHGGQGAGGHRAAPRRTGLRPGRRRRGRRFR
jgi:hypothetical protein